MVQPKQIAIVGGGPGGLVCARILQLHGIEVAVYDADVSATSRNQGGTLDMQADKGQIALSEAQLMPEFTALARPEGQSKRRISPQGVVLNEYIAPEGEDGSPEIDRGQLRTLLANSLKPGTLHWNRKVSAVEATGQGNHTIRFADGSSIDTHLVIGADGTWSRVRPLVSPTLPVYTGLTWMEAHFNDVEARHPQVARLVGHGHTFAIGDNRGLIGQRNSEQHVRVYIAMRVPQDWHQQQGIDLADTAALRTALVRHFVGWDAQLLHMITDNDGPYISRPLFVLPAPHRWTQTPGVTLLGDAAHVMSPFGGFGANLAMLEGAELALAIAQEETQEAAVRRYEQVMLPRSGALAVEANGVLDKIFKAGGSQHQPPDLGAEHERYKAAAARYGKAS